MQSDEISQSQDQARNSLGRPAWEGSADERWRPAGGGIIQVDSCSAPRRDGGKGGAGENREISGVDGLNMGGKYEIGLGRGGGKNIQNTVGIGGVGGIEIV